MCWSVPGKIKEIRGDNKALVELSGVTREVSTELISEPAEGEYVLIHAGYALQKVDEEKARFTIEFFRTGGKNA